MTKIYKKKFINILIILTVLLLTPITSFAEVGDKKWTKECTKDNKKVCVIAINNLMAIPNSDKKQILATVLIQLATTTERKMDLVDGKEKTYKLKEENKLIPILTIKFPLNVDLRKKPLIRIDEESILNIPFTHCNEQEGCITQITINDEVLKYFKLGKELTLIMAAYGSKDNMSIKLPLKGFSKAYSSLLK
jgi:invasion protein IalB